MNRRLANAALLLAAAFPSASAQSPPPAPPAVNLAIAPDRPTLETLAAQGWPAARDTVATALAASYTPSSTSNPSFVAWLNAHTWLATLAEDEPAAAARHLAPFLRNTADDSPVDPAELAESLRRGANAARHITSRLPKGFELRNSPVAERLDPATALDLAADAAFCDAFAANISPRDFLPATVEILGRIRRERPALWPDYRPLALAIAIVHDQPAPETWPHHQVERAAVPIETHDPLALFDYWSGLNTNRKLLLDLRKLGPGQLKFVIDAPLPFSEFDWAREQVDQSRTSFARAFSSIRYDRRRIDTQTFTWPGSRYTLAAIKATGGICVDQAYFAMIAGKAHGLPTLFFSGQGADGGHAWFGYMRADDKWELDCGRYENQNYATGAAYDPQDWSRITDHDLASLAARVRDTPAFLASTRHLRMAALFAARDDGPAATAAIDNALAASKDNPDAWRLKTAILENAGDGFALRRHLEAAIDQFSRDDDLASEFKARLADLLRKQGDTANAERVEGSIIRSNKKERSDISSRAAAGQLAPLLAEKRFNDAWDEYRRLVRKLGETGGGNLYYEVVKPFVSALLEAGETKLAAKALQLAREELRPDRGSILDLELAGLERAATGGKRR